MNFTLNRLILFSLTILLILAVTILGLTFLTKNSLQDRFNLLGDGSVTRLINYIDKYVFIGTIELPSDTEYLFNYFSNKDGYIAFYQVVHRLDLNRSDPSNDQAKAYEECETKFPPVPLELHKPVLNQFYKLDNSGKIVRDSTGSPIKKIPKSEKQRLDLLRCFKQSNFGEIKLKIIDNKDNHILFDNVISDFGGQSISVSKGTNLQILITLSSVLKSSIKHSNRYEIYIKQR